MVCWPKSLKHYRHTNFLSNFITSYHDSNFSFINSSKMIDLFRVTGGLVLLQTIIPWNINDIVNIRSKNILFLSQVVAAGSFLLNYHDIQLRSYSSTNFNGVTPRWFNLLKKIVLANPLFSNHLKPEYCFETQVFDDYDTSLSIDDFQWNTGWANLWTPPEYDIYKFPTPGSPIFGKVFKFVSPAPPCLFQHFILTNLTNDLRSPSKRSDVLVPCTGCSFNKNRKHFKIKPKFKKLPCANFVDPLLPNPISTSPLLLNNGKNLYVPKRSLWPIMDQAVARFRFIHTPSVPNILPDQLSLDPDILTIESLFTSTNCITTLNNYRINLFSEKQLEFYTDGSHLFLSPPTQTFVSSAFLLIHDTLDISFAAALPPLWANSTNAEIFALLMTLFVCPFGSFVNINTDSLSMILSYNHLLRNNVCVYPSLLFKTPFYIYWCFIFKLIEQKQLTLSLVKVKAHSGNPFNEKVDLLAKSVLTDTPLSLSFSRVPYLSFIPTFQSHPINKEIRPFFKDFINSKSFCDFYNLQRNNRYKNQPVNWLCTFKLINYDSNNQTSYKESYYHKRRYQLLLEQLPTLEFLKLTLPDLYDSTWKCCICNISDESFSHIWTCSKVRTTITDIITSSIQTLKNHIFIHTSSNKWPPELQQILDPSHPYWILPQPSNSSFTLIDFIKGIVPSHFYLLINNFTKCQTKTYAILSAFYEHLIEQSITLIWKPRCALTIAKELSVNITKTKKRSKSCSSKQTLTPHLTPINDNNLNHLQIFANSFIHGRSWTLFNAVKTSCLKRISYLSCFDISSLRS